MRNIDEFVDNLFGKETPMHLRAAIKRQINVICQQIKSVEEFDRFLRVLEITKTVMSAEKAGVYDTIEHLTSEINLGDE